MDVALRDQILTKIAGAGFSERELDWLTALHGLISTRDVPISHVDLLDAVLKQPAIFRQKPPTLNDNIGRSATLLGFTKEQFTAAALDGPQLFYQKPETLNGNVERSATLLGFTKEQFAAAALERPSLFYQKPETLSDNVECSAALLGMTRHRFTAAALKEPTLLTLKPETLNNNVERSAALLGLTKEQFTAFALRKPQFFYQKPETLSGNVEHSAALLAMTKHQFVTAVLKQPSLLSQKPETLKDNVERSASLLGLTTDQFIAIALRKPSLFCRKPESLGDRKLYILKISESLGESRDFASVIQSYPVALTCGRNPLHARYIVAKLDLKRGAVGSFVVEPAAMVDKLIVDHFVKQIARTGKGSRALQVMYAQGLITTLPIGITPIERPPPRQRRMLDSVPPPAA